MNFTPRIKILIIVLAIVILGIGMILSWESLFPKTLNPVRVGSSKSSITISLLFLAMEQGYFEEEGIDLIFEPISAIQAFDQVIAHELDMAVSAETPAVFRSFEHDNFYILSSIYSAYNDPKIIARKSSNITTPGDLSGKNIGTTSQGQSAHYFLHLFMTKYGLSEEDVILSYHNVNDLTEGLATGKFDAIALFEPHVTQAASSLGDDALIFSEPELYYKKGLIVTNATFIEKNPESVVGVLRGLKRAEEFVAQNAALAAQILAKRLSISEAEVHSAWNQAYLEVTLDQVLLLTMENEARWALENRYTHATVMPNFLDYMYFDGLESIDPDAVSIIH